MTTNDVAEDAMRGTGRTTGLMLAAIGAALLSPDTRVRFVDHCLKFHSGGCRRWRHKQHIENLARRLGLSLDVGVDADGVWVMSPMNRLRAEKMEVLKSRRESLVRQYSTQQ